MRTTEGSIVRLSTIVLLLASFLAVSPILCEVSGQAAGVKDGDWVKYGITGNYPGLADIDWIKIEITKVDGASVTGNVTQRMLNGTEPQSQETDLTIGSSQGGLAGIGFIIPANSKVGDTISFGGTSFAINQETTRTYGGVSRTVVGVSISVVGQVSANVFWDKSSGFLLEASSSSQGQSLSIVASAFSLSGVNAGGGGELLGLGWWIWVIIIAVVVVVIVGLVFVLRRRKHPITTVPPPPETPPPP